ncbi:MAG: SGNH/GDSL hydrolase family protein, partial [Clostridia bacterium]|nr:SGNH/GDSL hydrolase family protein [Clostridia bacterium]
MLDYLFPLLRYHSRLTAADPESAIGADDFAYFGRTPPVSHNGYLMQANVVPNDEEVDDASLVRGLSDYALPETAMEYLEKMRVLCEENGAELILVKSPTNSWGYWWYDEWDEQIVAYADEHDLTYYNFIDDCD